MINKYVSSTGVAMMAAIISACGGGGGSSGDASPLPVVGTESGETSQSLPVATIPAPVPSGASATGLNSLLGNVTLAYRFTGDSTVFTTQTTFSNSSFSVTNGGATVLESTTTDRAIVCGVFPSGIPYEYLCVVARATDGSGQITSQNIFLFDLTSATEGEGVFEFCFDDELIGDACINEVVARPDGPLAVGVSQQFARSTRASSGVDGIAVTEEEFDSFHAAAEAEFGNRGSVRYSPVLIDDDLVQTYKAVLNHIK